jgi:hypothetical protein
MWVRIRVIRIGHIPRGPQPGDGARQVLVHDNAVVEHDVGALHQLGAGREPDPDQEHVALHGGAVGQHHLRGGAVTAETVDSGPEVQVHPVLGVEVPEHGPHLGPEHPFERHRRPFDQGDLRAHLAGGRGDLGPDPSRSDHHEPVGAGDGVAQGVAARQAAQVVDPGQIGTGDRQSAGCRSRGEEQFVVLELTAGIEHHPLGGRIEAAHRSRGQELDVLLVVEPGVVHGSRVEADLAAEIGLGQRGSLVGSDRFVTDQHHPSLESLGS